MKVIHLISGGDSGGGKTHIYTLLARLKEEVNIELICLTDGPFHRGALELGINSVLVEQKNRLDFSVVNQIEDKIKSHKVDILHCHGARANFIGARLKKKISIPIITTVHSDYKQDFTHSLYKRLIFTPLNRRALMKMDYYLGVTDIFKELLVSQGFERNKIFTFYNGVNVMEMPEREADKVPLTSLVFGCVTTFRPIKGTHILLEAIKELVDEGYNPKLKIAGTGTGKYADELIEYVSDNKLREYVELKGFVSDMDQFYDEIDVNILPSFTEGFPYALLESGVREKGIIATKVGGIVEMIEDGKTGRLFEAGDVKALRDIMIQFIKEPELKETYGKAMRQAVIEKFSADTMAKRHVEIYNKILKN